MITPHGTRLCADQYQSLHRLHDAAGQSLGSRYSRNQFVRSHASPPTLHVLLRGRGPSDVHHSYLGLNHDGSQQVASAELIPLALSSTKMDPRSGTITSTKYSIGEQTLEELRPASLDHERRLMQTWKTRSREPMGAFPPFSSRPHCLASASFGPNSDINICTQRPIAIFRDLTTACSQTLHEINLVPQERLVNVSSCRCCAPHASAGDPSTRC
ncbi:hypothetical protein CONLIGDRAFT_101887 [Coniochaeta ligniaria NRRL 30616]|uniref:Uncharacterized protein n=1 Tax=Coniochaeta ligniaria NRRL 30616 TaxID=1408157 RepID=A0A1J7IB11_9PEZI|nr:hypothetical protein CONLIGDRAFT_101887 [Coniochaeta ligniaria NRRL 30616]